MINCLFSLHPSRLVAKSLRQTIAGLATLFLSRMALGHEITQNFHFLNISYVLIFNIDFVSIITNRIGNVNFNKINLANLHILYIYI